MFVLIREYQGIMRKSRIKPFLFLLLSVAVGASAYFYLHLKAADKPDEIKIFMTYYKPYLLPVKGEIFQPIQVGRAIEKVPFAGGALSDTDIKWLHDYTIGDDTGDNISAKNRSFDVLTAYYWVWKHYKEIGNPKYIGFFAHRKILMPETENCCVFDKDAPDFGLTTQGLLPILNKHRVMVNSWVPWVGKHNASMFDQYKDCSIHHVEDLMAMIEIIRRDYPEMVGALANAVYDVGHSYAIWNYWVMEKELAFDYFERLFHVMFELEKERGSIIARYDLKQQRVFGYLAERFFAIWLEFQQRTNGIEPFVAKAMLVE